MMNLWECLLHPGAWVEGLRLETPAARRPTAALHRTEHGHGLCRKTVSSCSQSKYKS